ncbi:MFS transporter [Priestia megaterium]
MLILISFFNLLVFTKYLFLYCGSFCPGFFRSRRTCGFKSYCQGPFQWKRTDQIFTLIVLVGNLGPIVAPIVGGAILSFTKWNGVFIVLACIGAILIFMVSLKLPETLPPEKRVPSNLPKLMSNFGSLFKEREFMGYAFTQGFTTAGIFAYVSGIPFVYQNIYHVSPQQFSLLFGVNGLGLIIGSQLVGRLADYISERKFLKVGLGISIAAGAILLIALLLNAPLIAVAIPIFFLSHQSVLLVRRPLH